MAEKICNTCGILKPLSEYGKCARHEDGKQNHCKACAALARARLKKAKTEKNTNGHIYAIINGKLREYENKIQAATLNLVDYENFIVKHDEAKKHGSKRFVCESIVFSFEKLRLKKQIDVRQKQGPLLMRPQVMGLGVLYR